MSTPVRILIVDDEPIAQDILETFIARIPGLQLVQKCRNALEAFQVISNQPVDLVLLDINMPEITGINFLKTLKDPPCVIFTTAYAEFAVESYELNAVDYLLKPVSFERFMQAINKAVAVIAPKGNAAPKVQPAADSNELMFVKAEGRLVKIDLARLWFVEGLKDYVRLWTEDGKILVHSTMKNFEESLSKYPHFVRVHKSHIINIKFISEIDGNTVYIKGQTVVIGSTYKDEVTKLLDGYRLL
jgi:DNA-binding LytR/AlgR family response regulator